MKRSIPPKPPEANWTDEQWQAIHHCGSNTLVAAGAGSGKTRVLVERIIEKILDGQDPVEIDKLLVVTFTNAAAAEMRQRISRALEKAIRNNPASTHLRRQMLLLNRASIMTLHSFCREVIKKYYYLRDADPSCRILDETEGILLRQELIEEVLEEYYNREEEGGVFYQLVETYSTYRGDEALQTLVQRLYDFSRSHPWPGRWLQEKAAQFNIPKGELEAEPWLRMVGTDCTLELKGSLDRLSSARRIAMSPGGPLPYLKNLDKEIEMLTRALETASGPWPEFAEAVTGISFDSLTACKKTQYDAELIESAKALRAAAKKSVETLQDDFFQRTLGEQEEEIRALAPLMETLVTLVESFSQRYRKAKDEKGLVDFHDLEHQALDILREPASRPGTLVPSQAALNYRQRFREVLVDEYQDTNQVQETILQLITGGEDSPGNLFMVGDVKQSIYRFRLAEPGLFMEKYRDYSTQSGKGRCIDLSRNFRSRQEVLRAVNYIFYQLMDEVVGEINYTDKTALAYGAAYPPFPGEKDEGQGPGTTLPVEVLLIDRKGHFSESEEGSGKKEGEELPKEDKPEQELEKASLEGRLIAAKIRELMGSKQMSPALVFDKEDQSYRPIRYRDIVILLRSTQNWAPSILEELRDAGIPAYAEMASGYFSATEVEVMLSLLRVIDNPYQDIPLAAVLRSPLVGLSEEDLALIRAAAPGVYFYEALQAFCQSEQPHSSLTQAGKFLDRLGEWQRLSRQGSLADLIWQVYLETGYYDLVGGMPGGQQRQANLRALYDRARQYEATSFRGLFRFLRFVEKIKDKGGDLGAARALGEQEDVVRILTIHKSKGLEFPVVFLAGAAKEFNQMDVRQDFLLHKELGFGPRFVDTLLKVSYPTLPFLAVRQRIKLELLAEEMRILYVALTRAEERLFLVATVKDIDKEVGRWMLGLPGGGEVLLPAPYRAAAKGYLDWLGPALLRHPAAGELLEKLKRAPVPKLNQGESSTWQVFLHSAAEIGQLEIPQEAATEGERSLLAAVEEFAPVPCGQGGAAAEEVNRRLSWFYPREDVSKQLAKLSVSELKKRRQQEEEESSYFKRDGMQQLVIRPRFLGQDKLSPTERGTAYHAVMQHILFKKDMDVAEVTRQLEDMVAKEKITTAEKEAVQALDVAAFFASILGQRLLLAWEVKRELSFNLALPAGEIYEDLPEGLQEKVLLQGVIDCLFRDEAGLVLLDYKTDRTEGLMQDELRKRYKEQVAHYGRAVSDIWQEDVQESYLYFFDRRLTIRAD